MRKLSLVSALAISCATLTVPAFSADVGVDQDTQAEIADTASMDNDLQQPAGNASAGCKKAYKQAKLELQKTKKAEKAAADSEKKAARNATAAATPSANP